MPAPTIRVIKNERLQKGHPSEVYFEKLLASGEPVPTLTAEEALEQGVSPIEYDMARGTGHYIARPPEAGDSGVPLFLFNHEVEVVDDGS